MSGLGIGDPRGFWLVALLLLFIFVLSGKMKRRRAPLTTFFILKRLARRMDYLSRRLRIFRRLALLLLFLAAFCLAAASLRPFFDSGRPPLTEMLVVDLSPSLGVKDGKSPRLQVLRRLVRRRLKAHGLNDKVVMVAAGRQAEVKVFEGGRPSERWADELEYGDVAADIEGAVKQALAAAARYRPQRLTVISDDPRRWRALESASPVPKAEFGYERFGAPAANAGIIRFDLRRDFFTADTYDLFLGISHEPSDDKSLPDKFTLEILAAGTMVSRHELRCPAGETADLLIRSRLVPAGPLEVKLIPEDAYPADNSVIAGIHRGGAVRVNAVTGGNRFLENALEANPSLEVRKFKPGEELPVDEAAVWIFDGLVPPDPLPAKALFIQPNRPLPGLNFRSFVFADEQVDWDPTEPILQGVDLTDLSAKGVLDFADSAVFRAPAMMAGHPLILLSQELERRWIVLAFNPAESRMVYTPSYPILTANAVRWLSLLAETERSWTLTGEAVSLGGAARGGLVRLPNGKTVGVGKSGEAPIFIPVYPGSYLVSAADGADLGWFYVNVLDENVTREAAMAAAGFSYPTAPPPLRWSMIFFSPWLVLAAVCLLAGESTLAYIQFRESRSR